jgi:type I restriction enzyme, S subunit
MSGLVSPQYVNMYMNSLDCRRTQIEPQIVQQNGQANFNGTKLQHICVPLPPLAEQARIVLRVEELQRLCADLRERLTARQTCQARFAGALVMQAASTAPFVTHAGELAAAA